MKRLTRVLAIAGLAALCLPITADSGWTLVDFTVAPGACAAAPAGMTGSALIRLVEKDNGHGNLTFIFGAIGSASDPDGNRWILGDHDAGVTSPSGQSFFTEKFHLIGQGQAPNLSISILFHVSADGTILVDKAKGLDILGCTGDLPF
jgi:hypothetical protein